MWRVTLRGLAAHKVRLGLTAVAIVLGVAFVSGTFVLTDTMRQVFEDVFGEATAGVDVHVRAEEEADVGGFGDTDRERVPEGLLEQVAGVDGVDVAAGTVSGFAQIVDAEGEPIAGQGPTFGTTWGPDRLNPLSLREGRPPQGPGEVVIDAATAREHGFEPGDTVTVILVGGPQELELVGTAGFGEADSLAGATLAVFELGAGQDAFGFEDEYSSIEVAAAEGTDPAALREDIAAGLPEGYEAVLSEDVNAEMQAQIDEGLGFFTTALLVFAAVGLFVGGFIIANTFTIVVAQRTREFALLRAVGASGKQVTRSVIGESAVVGFVASGLGIALGVVLAMGLRGLLGAFGLSLPGGGFVLLPRTIIVGFVIGMGVTVLSALLPARRAAKVDPLVALRWADAPPTRVPNRRIAAGTAMLAVGGVGFVAGVTGTGPWPLRTLGLGAAVVFLGVALLAPLVARPVGQIIGAPAARLGTPGKLGRANVLRDPRRTAATASALMIGLALVSFVAILADSVKASMAQAVEESFVADFIVESQQQGPMGGFSPQVAEELREREELGVVSAQRFGRWEENGSSHSLLAVEPETFAAVTGLEEREGSLSELAEGGVFLEAEAAAERDLGVGETISMAFARTGPVSLEVAGIFEGAPAIGQDFIISNETYEELYTNRLDQLVSIRAADGVPPAEAREAIEDVAEGHPNVVVRDQAELLADREGTVDQLLGLVTVLLLLAIVIALLGITSTLALSVFERTRELGLLRAVGMGRRQTRSMVRWEAMIVALLGALLGIVVGIVFGWGIVQGVEGFQEFSMPGGQLVTYVVAAGVAGVIAGVFPARRAARLNVLEAIATE